MNGIPPGACSDASLPNAHGNSRAILVLVSDHRA